MNNPIPDNTTTSTSVLEKKLKIFTWILTGIVVVLVGLMRRIKIPLPDGVDFSFLPPFYSTLNALAAIVLLLSLYFIKQKNVVVHQRMNYLALGLSALFLLCYVLYHFTTPETLFGDADGNKVLDAAEAALVQGSRPYYLALLFSHIVLAAVSLPFILLTFIRGYLGQYEKHRKLARWVWPVWFYVCITGPVCYFMLKPYY
jgi:putative membrane protein